MILSHSKGPKEAAVTITAVDNHDQEHTRSFTLMMEAYVAFWANNKNDVEFSRKRNLWFPLNEENGIGAVVFFFFEIAGGPNLSDSGEIKNTTQSTSRQYV